MPAGTINSTDGTKPYYSSLVPEGMFTGKTRWVDYPFNRGCAVCNPPVEPEEPEETKPDSETEAENDASVGDDEKEATEENGTPAQDGADE